MARVSLLALVPALLAAACSDRQPSSEVAPRHDPQAAAPWVDATRAKALVAAGGIVVDVREASELAETGKLRSALHLPLPSIKVHAAARRVPPELEPYRGRPMIFYCRSGRRSGEAAEALRKLGMTDVYNLGGFEDAARAGFPVELGNGS